jgi:hypothetical protein
MDIKHERKIGAQTAIVIIHATTNITVLGSH